MGMMGARRKKPYEHMAVWPYNAPHYYLHHFALLVNSCRDREIRRAHPSWVATGGRCFYCGEPASVLDHLLPKSLGGDSRAGNLVAACWECNSAKCGNTVEQFRLMRAVAVGDWCYFSSAQIAWLAGRGISLPLFPGYVFWGERRSSPQLVRR